MAILVTMGRPFFLPIEQGSSDLATNYPLEWSLDSEPARPKEEAEHGGWRGVVAAGPAGGGAQRRQQGQPAAGTGGASVQTYD